MGDILHLEQADFNFFQQHLKFFQLLFGYLPEHLYMVSLKLVNGFLMSCELISSKISCYAKSLSCSFRLRIWMVISTKVMITPSVFFDFADNIGKDIHLEPSQISGLDFFFKQNTRIYHLLDILDDTWESDVILVIANRPSNIIDIQAELFHCRGREFSEDKVCIYEQLRNDRIAKIVFELVIKLDQFFDLLILIIHLSPAGLQSACLCKARKISLSRIYMKDSQLTDLVWCIIVGKIDNTYVVSFGQGLSLTY
ncbi:hypothetical protein SAMN06297358_1239 [Pedobacter xixiisoli]|uniref:Uncharacterized protein n=1 Tax=Pedobacter xixiisoli TaxID=1476464 RepID=A0A285ZVW7_9SPHI|nr:hypothetical protein SAMN06297358_1239 [Pedobacter xixiisoli]